MRTLYMLRIEAMNGNIALNEETSVYTCREMRDAVLERVQEANKNADVKVRYTKGEIKLYEAASEIPILNSNK